MIPGTFVSQHSGAGKAHQIFFRGFDAVHGQDLEFVVGGVPVNDVSNVHGQGYADLHFVIPETVRELRALPGPLSAEQGDFAVAGTLRFELGVAEPGTHLALAAGSHGTRRVLGLHRPHGAPEQTFAAFEAWSTDGWGVGRAASRATATGQLEQPLGGELSARVLATAYAGRFSSPGVLRLADVEAGRIARGGSYDTDQGGRSTRSSLAVELTDDQGDSTFSLLPFVVQRTLLLRQNYTGYLVDPIRGDAVLQRHDATTFGARAAVRRGFELTSDHDTLALGFEVRDDSVDQGQERVSAVDDAVTDRQVDAQLHVLDAAGWAELTLHPLRRVLVRGGVRADALSFRSVDRLPGAGASATAQGLHVGSKLTVDVTLLPGWRALASYGEGFRSPQARSVADGERAPFTTVRHLELGTRWSEGRRWQAAAAAFVSTLSGDLVFDEALARNTPAPGTERVGGVVELVAEPTPRFVSAVGFTWVQATFREAGGRWVAGERVPFVPEAVTRADLAWTPHLGAIAGWSVDGRAGFGLSHVHHRPLPYRELGNDVLLADAEVGARAGALELEVSATQLLGREWFDGEFAYASNFQRGAAPSLVPARHVTVGAPRALLATLVVHL